jgi:hypothetical protein
VGPREPVAHAALWPSWTQFTDWNRQYRDGGKIQLTVAAQEAEAVLVTGAHGHTPAEIRGMLEELRRASGRNIEDGSPDAPGAILKRFNRFADDIDEMEARHRER